MILPAKLRASAHLTGVNYEIRGPLARRAEELERGGAEIIKMNIGNPGYFDFRMPETMRQAMVENLRQSDAYCHQKGIFPAREAVVMRCQSQGVMDVTSDDVFIGNGVSELILMTVRALINPGDEVLVPSPDYPLWTAAVVMHGGRAVHYPCKPENDFQPDPGDIAQLVTDRTKAIVVINPNNPTGAVYSETLLKQIVDIAEERGLVIFSDEIYDQILYDESQHTPMAPLVKHTLCATFNGLSKVYRACGMRVGWVYFNGERRHASEYIQAVELLASLRLCSNVPGQWAVQTALGGFQSIHGLTAPEGRLYETRQALLDTVEQSKHLSVCTPKGAMYGFLKVESNGAPFNDQDFAMRLLEDRHILCAPGSSFNVPYSDHLRVTLLPQADVMAEVIESIDSLLSDFLEKS